MAANKRNKSQRKEMVDKALHMLSRGESRYSIARQLGESQRVIDQVLKTAVDLVVKERTIADDEERALKIAEYKEVKREAWLAWERSKADAQKIVVERFKPRPKKDEDGNEVEQPEQKKTTRSNEGRLPSSSYLTIILQCIQAERELMGLDPDLNINLKQTHAISWDSFSEAARKAASIERHDQVEQELMKMIEDPNRGLNPPPPVVAVRVVEDPDDNREEVGTDE